MSSLAYKRKRKRQKRISMKIKQYELEKYMESIGKGTSRSGKKLKCLSKLIGY